MAHAWNEGGTEAVASLISRAQRDPNDQHLWAVVGNLANHLPAADKTAKSLAGIKRTSSTICMLINANGVQAESESQSQGRLFKDNEELL
jgi:hypothetical protein